MQVGDSRKVAGVTKLARGAAVNKQHCAPITATLHSWLTISMSAAGFVGCKMVAKWPERVASLTMLSTTQCGWHMAAQMMKRPWVTLKVCPCLPNGFSLLAAHTRMPLRAQIVRLRALKSLELGPMESVHEQLSCGLLYH